MTTRTEILAAEKASRKASDMAYEAAKKEWEELDAAYREMRKIAGDGVDRIADLVRRFGPKLATRLGLPGLGAMAAGLTADTGGFSGILGALKGLLGFVF